MANETANEIRTILTDQLDEIRRQVWLSHYPFDFSQLKAHLQIAIEGSFDQRERFRVKPGGSNTTDQVANIYRDAGLYCNKQITQANFPLNCQYEESVQIEIISPNFCFGEEEGLRYLSAAGLERPSYSEALRFAEQFGRTTAADTKSLIVFLHEPWRAPDGARRVIAVNRYPGRIELSLAFVDPGFVPGCALAGIRLAPK